MSRTIRGRLNRLERDAPAPTPSILTNGRFWDMVAGCAGECTPAELAEADAILREVEERPSATDQVERLLADAEAESVRR